VSPLSENGPMRGTGWTMELAPDPQPLDVLGWTRTRWSSKRWTKFADDSIFTGAKPKPSKPSAKATAAAKAALRGV
jgi:hypothetical protein